MKSLLNTTQAAEKLDVHENTLRRYVANGTLKAYRVGKLLKFREEDLNKLEQVKTGQSYWRVEGKTVVLRQELLGARWSNLHYEFGLADLVANPDRWIQHLKTKQWWRAGMAEEFRGIVLAEQAPNVAKTELA